jgi:hypothetical protein
MEKRRRRKKLKTKQLTRVLITQMFENKYITFYCKLYREILVREIYDQIVWKKSKNNHDLIRKNRVCFYF